MPSFPEKRGQAAALNDEPLRRQRAACARLRAFSYRRHDVDAQLQVAERLVHREGGDDVLVQRGDGCGIRRTRLFYAALVAEIGQLVTARRAAGKSLLITVLIRLRSPIRNCVHLRRRRIDADQRDTPLSRAGQYMARPVKRTNGGRGHRC